MAREKASDAQAPAAEGVPALSTAASFEAWWQANIPNSPVSRDTTVYNQAYALRSQLLAVLSSVTGD